MSQTVLQKWVESKPFERVIVVSIILNAIILGLETHSGLTPSMQSSLSLLDKLFLTLFTAELAIKMFVYRFGFFKDPWRIFDLLVVGISLMPSSGALSVLRSLRVLRTLRVISVVPSLRKVVTGLLSAIPGLGAVSAILGLLFYSSAVMATKLFGASFPDWFGTIWKSFYTLFQVMTLESWSMGIVRPLLDVFPYAWVFFVPFILVTTFTMLNLFIAVIVNAMNIETDEAAQVRDHQSHEERAELLSEVKLLRAQIDKISSQLEMKSAPKSIDIDRL